MRINTLILGFNRLLLATSNGGAPTKLTKPTCTAAAAPAHASGVAVCCSVLQCVAVCCSVLQCVAVCFSVLQCVPVCCSVLQCIAVYFRVFH